MAKFVLLLFRKEINVNINLHSKTNCTKLLTIQKLLQPVQTWPSFDENGFMCFWYIIPMGIYSEKFDEIVLHSSQIWVTCSTENFRYGYFTELFVIISPFSGITKIFVARKTMRNRIFRFTYTNISADRASTRNRCRVLDVCQIKRYS